MTIKWFTVATEGQTTDGRVIERSWLQEIADTYSRAKYGARIWLEHIRGILPDSPFKAYGDVLAVRAQKNAEGKLELQAQLDPTPELIALSKARQKIYTSVEIAPNFAETGKCGLVGLAITDSPASLCTSILEFSAQHPEDNPYASRKQSPDNLFSSAIETALDFSETPEDATNTLFARIADLFRTATAQQQTPQPKQQQTQPPAPVDMETVAQTFAAFQEAHKETQIATSVILGQFSAELNALKASTTTVNDELKSLRALLDKTPGSFTQRPPATGSGADRPITDC